MPRSVLLGRPLPHPGEPLFLPDDIDGALELQRDEDGSCPRGHHLDETSTDDGPLITVESLTCAACAAEDSSRRLLASEVRDAGETAADLLDGVYFVAVVDED